jgi:sporulation protein YlmC with PRC-barrel domain/DNA-directed RNA polymerase subunit RPC12/RpoP
MIAEDMAEKKVRGSGGYAIVRITEEEQKKGNLGGPELFLAGIGRLDEDRFVKYYCNRCEKDYEDSPAIVYENPNEELGEGVTLVEKGEYKCKVCNATLAQYRKFDAPQQPIQQEQQTADQLLSTVSEKGQDSQDRVSNQAGNTITEGGFIPVQSLVGMSAYDSEAMHIGKVEQIGLRKTGASTQIIIKAGGREISWNDISKIGDIVLVKNITSGTNTMQGVTPQSSRKCASCGFQNEADAVFCEECGTKLG